MKRKSRRLHGFVHKEVAGLWPLMNEKLTLGRLTQSNQQNGAVEDHEENVDKHGVVSFLNLRGITAGIHCSKANIKEDDP